MMLIFSIIVMSSYLYSVCLIAQVSENTYFKEHLLVVTSKYRKWDMENNT